MLYDVLITSIAFNHKSAPRKGRRGPRNLRNPLWWGDIVQTESHNAPLMQGKVVAWVPNSIKPLFPKGWWPSLNVGADEMLKRTQMVQGSQQILCKDQENVMNCLKTKIIPWKCICQCKNESCICRKVEDDAQVRWKTHRMYPTFASMTG